jgi:hypothetical protein
MGMPGFSSSNTDASTAATGTQFVIGGGTIPVYVWLILAAVAVLGGLIWLKSRRK